MALSAFFDNLVPFFMINARLIGLLMLSPMYGHAAIPAQVKAAVIMVLSLVLHFGLGIGFHTPQLGTGEMFVGMIREFLTGASMGLVLMIYFAGFAYAAGIIAPQMGMAISQLVDPQTEQMQPLLSTFFTLLGVLLFLAIDGHLIIIKALHDSYRIVPLFGFNLSGEMANELIRISSQIFIIAFKLAVPVLAVIIFLNTGMALIARAVPQVNVLVVGFIITISVGLWILSLLLPALDTFFVQTIHEAFEQMMWLLKTE